MNTAFLIGRLGKEPDVKYTQDGKMITSFNLATDEQWKDKNGERVKKTEWHKIVTFGKLAEICGNYLKKGSKVFCSGRIETQSWEKDGQKHYKTVIILSSMEMLDSKKSEDTQPESQQAPLDDVPF